ncbi:MAG: hypothetical protein J0M08_05375 [Bacteroidetes bacterium]|nr:hypothetical protein [Bacteroidota bacterium]
MDNFFRRINTESLYQFIGETKIDYHAGIYFVYKKTNYLKFFKNHTIKYFERIEGQHLDDTNFLKLNESLLIENKDIQTVQAKGIEWNNNIVLFEIKRNTILIPFYCMPSKLIELIDNEITEVVFDNHESPHKTTEVYRLI